MDIYARSDFKEFPRTLTGVCTHKYIVYEDAIKVRQCKELAGPIDAADTFSECVYKGVYYTPMFDGFTCGTTDEPGAFGGNTGGNTTVVPAITTTSDCADACSQSRQRCQWYSFVSTAASEVCTLYSGECTEGDANADEIVH
jgi:hypothetical protein